MIITYGVPGHYIDVTRPAAKQCLNGTTLSIPANDWERDKLFGDPIFGTVKHILVKVNDLTFRFDNGVPILIEGVTMTFQKPDFRLIISSEDKLAHIHKTLVFHGDIKDEYPEQLMTMRLLPSTARVLELGSHIGRNTMVIATILDDSRNLVTLEPNPEFVKVLTRNRDDNDYHFHIETCALSYRPLVYDGFDSAPAGGPAPSNFKPIPTVTFETLVSKYGQFDTLVADCEGALFYILSDRPQILDCIKLVIMENDYRELAHKLFVDGVLTRAGLKCIYREAGGWGPCQDRFFEAWSR